MEKSCWRRSLLRWNYWDLGFRGTCSLKLLLVIPLFKETCYVLLMKDNCDELLQMATKYEIPRLENDVIVTLPLINPELTRQPHLFNLPLRPFDVFTYGKVYSIPLLARHNESHV